ncbi:MAG: bifunctional folylpolyglutamate synthase/dihydrofolate synthase [Myxococcota bacterium]|nr:bifunctional folylpolyglutamate synthase/dihydrofolate synthase [Myxococcota bacterium]
MDPQGRPRPRTPQEALEFFSRLSPSTIRLGLDRVRSALERLGRPDRAYRSLQVAGTNGKGSTCAFAAQILQRSGYRVGLYTSPHLVRVTERIRVDGEEVSPALFGQRILEVIQRLPEVFEDPPGLTYFEVGTLVALWHFAQAGVELAVLETGLGGRLDATTAASAQVTAITSVSLDHQSYLGDTLGQIAAEKAGILRPGTPVVVSRQQPTARKVIEAAAQAGSSPLMSEGQDFRLESGVYTGPGMVRLEGLTLSLAGPHQTSNAAVAVTAARLLGGERVTASAVRTGLAHTAWPGRFEQLQEHPAVIVDGAHNPEGAEILRAALAERFGARPVHLVFGVLADKDHSAIRATLFPGCASIHLCPVPSPRSLDPQDSRPQAHSACSRVSVHPSVGEALEAALEAAAPGDVVVCAGSLFLVGAARSHFRK